MHTEVYANFELHLFLMDFFTGILVVVLSKQYQENSNFSNKIHLIISILVAYS